MISLENKNIFEFNYTNPYRKSGPNPLAPKEISPFNSNQTLADRVVYWAKAILFNDYEKNLELVDKGAYLLDKGVVVVVGGLQGAMIVDGFFHLNIITNSPFSFIPSLLKVVLIPASIFFFVMGIIEGIFEVINLRRGVEILKGISKENSALNQLNWIKERYFTLEQTESDKIFKIIEEKLPDLDQASKAIRFDQIAQKALQVKYDNLKRRISPGLAEEVKNELNTSINQLQSQDIQTRENAAKRVEALMESVSKQAKLKILIHVLALAAIFFTVLSALSMFSGFGTLPFFIAMGALTAILFLCKFYLQKGEYDQQANTFQKKVSTIQLEGASAAS